MRCSMVKYERTQCKRSDIRCDTVKRTTIASRKLNDWFVRRISIQNYFFPNLSSTMKSKHIHYTHTTLKVDLSFIKFLWYVQNSLHHRFIRSDGRIKREIIQLSILFILLLLCFICHRGVTTRHKSQIHPESLFDSLFTFYWPPMENRQVDGGLSQCTGILWRENNSELANRKKRNETIDITHNLRL